MGLIQDFASNIETKDSTISFIDNFQQFDLWEFETKHRKLFLYDEVMESSASRDAMTTLNKNWVRRIGQFSKGRLHLVAITQAEMLMDSIFRNPIFNRGLWIKENITTLTFQSPYISHNHRFLFQDIPKTHIDYDPYLSASFHLVGSNEGFPYLPKPMQVLALYSEGKSFREIQKIVGEGSPQQVKQDLVLICRVIVKQWRDKAGQDLKIKGMLKEVSKEFPEELKHQIAKEHGFGVIE